MSTRSQDDVNISINQSTRNNLNVSFNNNNQQQNSGYLPSNSYNQRQNLPYLGGNNDGYYSTGNMREPSIGPGPGGTIYEPDTRSIGSTPSKISKFTYSEYPQIRPTNPLYTSTATIKTATSAVSRGSTMNTVSRRQKYNPKIPRRINDWRWVSALAVLLFFPTGLIALGLAFKAQTKFDDGFIDDAKKLNKRSFALCCVSFFIGAFWIMFAFFMMDIWPRTNG